MLTYSHLFFSISLSLFFCMSDYIFVLSDQNTDLAGHMSLQKKKKLFSARWYLSTSVRRWKICRATGVAGSTGVTGNRRHAWKVTQWRRQRQRGHDKSVYLFNKQKEWFTVAWCCPEKHDKLVSFAAVFRDVTQRSPERNGGCCVTSRKTAPQETTYWYWPFNTDKALLPDLSRSILTLPCIHQFFELSLFTRGLYNAFPRFGSACDKINTEVFPLTWKLKLFGKRTFYFQNTFHVRFSFVFGLLCSVFYGGKLRLKTKAQGTAGLASSVVGSRFLVREHMFKNELPWEICEESKPLC